MTGRTAAVSERSGQGADASAATTRVSREELLSSNVRRRIVDLVHATPGKLAAADLGARLDLHVTTVRFHLDQLEQAGVLAAERERRESVGRPRKVYSLAPESIPVNEAAYVVLASVLAEALPAGEARAEAAAKAGEAWVARHVDRADATDGANDEAAGAGPDRLPVRRLVDVLARWGYQRESVTVESPSPGTHRLTLQHCPMKEAAAGSPHAVCGAHLGLIRGTLHEMGIDGTDVTVRPMVAPDVCLVELCRPSEDPAHEGVGVLDLAGPRRRSQTPA